MYGLGVTLYHAIVGEPPFPLKDRKRAMELHLTTAPPRPSERLPGCPAPVERLLLKMLAKRPDERHRSYEELLAELHTVANGLPS